MKKSQLESLGITTSPRSLLHSEAPQVHAQGQRTEAHAIRKGQGVSPRDRLEAQLNSGFAKAFPEMKMERMSPHAQEKEQNDWIAEDEKRKEKADAKFKEERTDYSGTLKNTHGEEFHDDNDKQVEEMVSHAEEVDREFDQKAKRPATSRQPYEFNGSNPQDEKRYTYKSQRASRVQQQAKTREELFLKSFEAPEIEESFVIDKSFGGKKAPHVKKDPAEARAQRAERKRYFKGELVNWAKKEEKEHKMDKSMNSLDDIFNDIIEKGKFKEAKIDPELIANIHENSEGVVEKKNNKPATKGFDIKANHKFIKSNGVGGMVFDFGAMTGNPVADNATRLLNQFADPVQVANAQYQQESYNKAIEDFAQKGEQAFGTTATPFGNFEKGWGDQLNKPMDQQVQEAFDRGEFNEGGAPTPKNPKFEKSTATVGGQQVQAMSETDAAVLEMFKAEQAAMNQSGGFVADVSNGGKINVIAGLPLENQIPEHMK